MAHFRISLSETTMDLTQLIYPVFVHEGTELEAIESMPGQFRYPISHLDSLGQELVAAGIRCVLLFGVPQEKDDEGYGAAAASGVVQQAVRRLAAVDVSLTIITDVCLCAYIHSGHCGLVDENGRIDHQSSVAQLAKIAVSHAEAGAHMVAPSAMMDGQVAGIRTLLDAEGFGHTGILAYSAKFASAFYGPFREAAGSAPAHGDRRGYQLDPANRREAIREIEADIEEGADMVMVKPGLPYLDIIREARNQFDAPLVAYQVSGEYSMIKAAAQRGWIDEKAVAMESLIALRRAGADMIITYFARDVAGWLSS